eukprot:scaffold1045_cov257-Prasinococcus_capsulatus_cf.AAC.1
MRDMRATREVPLACRARPAHAALVVARAARQARRARRAACVLPAAPRRRRPAPADTLPRGSAGSTRGLAPSQGLSHRCADGRVRADDAETQHGLGRSLPEAGGGRAQLAA